VRTADGWVVRYEGLDPAEEGLREALCALGNGRMVTRAAAPEAVPGEVHRPGTYLAGVYDRQTSRVGGRSVENEDLVNVPNWLPLTFRAQDGPWFAGTPGEVVDHTLSLYLRGGLLVRRSRVRDRLGRITALVQRRIVHMGRPHLAALETTLIPENWSGALTVRSAVDGGVRNRGVARYRGLEDRHVTVRRTETAGDGVLLEAELRASHLPVVVAARTRITHPRDAAAGTRDWRLAGRVGQDLTVRAERGHPIVVQKIATVRTGRDPAIAGAASAAREDLLHAGDFDDLLRSHVARWRDLWARARVDLAGDHDHAARLYTFHLLQTLTRHTGDAGVPARGLHGEAYRGHVFWDELFVLPFVNLRIPETGRELLGHRYRRLDAARRAARAEGLAGAMYPWQSGSDGREETQRLHLNPRSGRWLPDHSHLQRHVGSAIAYNVWNYVQATADLAYLAAEGAELLVEIARFWGSLAVADPATGRHHIRGVMGPDEYHDAYPGAARPGIDDNAYTNVMASWVLRTAARALDLLPAYRRAELARRLALDREEIARWEEVSRRLHVPFHDGVVSQFAGYEDLAEFDWEGCRRRHGDIRRLDRVLEAEGDTTNRYRVSKQADVLMLGYLFPPATLAGLLGHLGYPVGPELLDRTTRYYLRRTAHGSTLSAVVHAWVLARMDRRASASFLTDALASDVHDIQGGTTPEGIHLGAMAGCLDLLTRGYPGLEIHEDLLVLDPVLPRGVGPLGFTIRYRGHWDVGVRLDDDHLSVSLPEGPAPPIRIGHRGRVHTVEPGHTWTAPTGRR
jgi:trehalose/maltose hydrolase-like predicted phosphorylase